MKFLPQSLIVAAFLAGVTSTPAAAQAPEERITVTFTPALATVGGDSELALSGSAGYRFTEHLSFEGDFTWIDGAAGGGRDRVFALGDAQLTTRGVNDILSRTTARFGAINTRNFPDIPNFPIPIEGFSASSNGSCPLLILRMASSRVNQPPRSTSGNACIRPDFGGHSISKRLLWRAVSSTSPSTVQTVRSLPLGSWQERSSVISPVMG